MSVQENTTLVHKFFDYLNQNNPNDLKSFETILASNIQIHDPALSHPKTGIEYLKQLEIGYIKAFPNKKVVIDDIFASNDRVAVYWTVSGTHKGEFQGLAPGNRDFKISGISLYRISNGKITEITQNWDLHGLLQQIGKTQYAHAH